MITYEMSQSPVFFFGGHAPMESSVEDRNCQTIFDHCTKAPLAFLHKMQPLFYGNEMRHAPVLVLLTALKM